MADNNPQNGRQAITLYDQRWYDQSSAQTQVNVVGIADKALNGIYDAIHRTSAGISSLTEIVTEEHEGSEEARNEERIRSLAAERRDRAVNNAVMGRMDKSFNLLDELRSMLKSVLGKLLDLVKDGVIKSLRKYDEFSADMRKIRLSNKDKKEAQLRADQAFLIAQKNGLSIKKDDITSFALSIADQPEFKSLSSEQLAIAAQLKAADMSTEKVLTAIRTAGNSPEALKSLNNIAMRMTDPKDREATVQLFEELVGTTEYNSIILEKYGGNAALAMEKMQSSLREVRAATGGFISGKSLSNIVKTQELISGSKIQAVRESEVNNLLAFAHQASFDGGEALSNYIKSQQGRDASYYEEMNHQLEAIKQIEGIDTDLIDGLSKMYVAMRNNEFHADEVTQDADLINNAKENAREEGGALERFMQTTVSSLNTATGGMLSDLSVDLDKLFGTNLGISDLASNGFKVVSDLLSKIHKTQIASSFVGGAGGAAGRGLIRILGAAAPYVGVLLGAAGIGAAIGYAIATPIAESIKKEANDAKEELNEKYSEIDELRALTERDMKLSEEAMLRGDTELAKMYESSAKGYLRKINELTLDAVVTHQNTFGKDTAEMAKEYTKAANKVIQGLEEQKKEVISNGADPVLLKQLDERIFELNTTIEAYNYKANSISGKMFRYTPEDIMKGVRETLKYKEALEGNDIKSLPQAASGGVLDKATPLIAGEKGREAILPMTNRIALNNVLKLLTEDEKKVLLDSLSKDGMANKNTESVLNSIFDKRRINTLLPKEVGDTAPGDDQKTLDKILSYASDKQYAYDSIMYGRKPDGTLKFSKPKGPKMRLDWYKEAIANASNQEGRDLIRGTYAEKALDWGVTQLGKPYLLNKMGNIGYVCNELTNSALTKSGFDMKDFAIHSVSTTFKNISNGKMVDHYDKRRKRELHYPEFRLRPDITPETALPGMVFFQQTGKNKDGQFSPGHVGLVYYGHQKLHSSGGTGKEGYNDPAKFLELYQTPCRGVTVTPFDNNQYRFGEFPGLFMKPNGESSPAIDSISSFNPSNQKDSISISSKEDNMNKPNKSKPATDKSSINKPVMTALDVQRRLSKQAIEAVVNSYSGKNRKEIEEYAKQAYALINSGSNLKEILEAMSSIIKYLRDIANSPANKKINPIIQKTVPTLFK